MDILLAASGLIILLLAGDTLVRGAVNLGLRLGVPALIVSLTIVAFGTSAPELLIAIKSVSEGVPALAIGNVVGSNIANVLLVLGVPALIFGINSSQCDSRKTYSFMLGATGVFIVLAFNGPLGIWHGVILLALLTAMLAEAFHSARCHRRNGACGPDEGLEEVEGADPAMGGWKIALFIVLGLIGLPLGAQLLVDGALGIADQLGISERVIGLTLVAIGTSLPELSTTIMAAARKHGDVAIGNAIGSNMFNLLGIMGITSFYGPLAIPPGILQFDVWVMLAAALVLVPFVFGRLNINRIWGGILSICYIWYIVVLF